jgi:hypothetical protein
MTGMKQEAIWLRSVVRKLLKGGPCTWLEGLRDQILAFIDASHRRMAKPVKWTDTGQASDGGAMEASVDASASSFFAMASGRSASPWDCRNQASDFLPVGFRLPSVHVVGTS